MFFTNQALKFKYQQGHMKVIGHQCLSADEKQEKQHSNQPIFFLKNHIWNAGKNANMAGIAVLM